MYDYTHLYILYLYDSVYTHYYSFRKKGYYNKRNISKSLDDLNEVYTLCILYNICMCLYFVMNIYILCMRVLILSYNYTSEYTCIPQMQGSKPLPQRRV